MLEDRRTVTLVTLVLCLIYVAARLWHLTDSCLWFDEVFSVHAAEHDWNSMLWFVAQDLIHPPLFYILLKLWIGVGGESILWLRLLPVLFSVLAIFPFVRLCRELKLRTPIILLSLFLLAVNGALIKYTQTLRMYSMLMCVSLLSMWLFARYFNRGKSLAALIIVNVILVYTHYFGWLVIGSEILAILIFQRIKWRGTLLMFGVAAVSFVPWLIAVIQAARQGSDLAQNIAWQTRPGIAELTAFAIDLVEPFYFQASNVERASIYILSLPLLFTWIVAAALYLVEWKREESKQSIYLLAFFVIIPVAVAFAASWLLPHSVWGTRHLIIVVPPTVALLANSLLSFPIRAVRIAGVSMILGISAVAFILAARREPPRYVWCAWNKVAADIRAKASPSELPVKIYAFENLVAYHLWFALRDSDSHRAMVVKGVDARTDDETYFLPRGFDGVKSSQLDEMGDENIWLAFRTSKAGESVSLLENFTRIGYAQCPAGEVAFGATTVFWMRMTKGNAVCD